MRKPALAVAAVAAALLFMSISTPAQAVTDGAPDGDAHPYVGIMVAKDDAGTPLWRCSGTLISSTVYVAAGHCTDGAATAELWFATTLQDQADRHGYPFTGEVTGVAYTYDLYDPDAFHLHDLGVVVLDEPVVLSEYGTLPTAGLLDTLAAKNGKKDVTFTSVGYGLQKSFPDAAAWKNQSQLTRMVATPKLIQINTGFTGTGSLLLSNNAHTGGTCFGDSGGPNFLGSSITLAGVTSFGLNSACGGTGGVYRLDKAEDIAWIESFLG